MAGGQRPPTLEGAQPAFGGATRVGNFSEQNWGDSDERRQRHSSLGYLTPDSIRCRLHPLNRLSQEPDRFMGSCQLLMAQWGREYERLARRDAPTTVKPCEP